jgi:hypothetical protein
MKRNLKVAFVGQPEYNNAFYETDLADLFTVRHFPVIFDPLRQMEASLATMGDLVDFAPDIAVFFRGEFIGNDVLGRVSGFKIAVSTEPFPKYIHGQFHFTLDSIGRFKYFTNIASRDLDCVFHYDESSLSFMEKMGVRVSASLILPVATGVWRPRKDAPIDWDLTFLGRSTTHRERHLGTLKRDYRFLHIAHGVMGRQAISYYQTAHIGLNLHSEPELSWEPRVQQMMACGVLVVSEPISPNELLEPGKHFVETCSAHQTYELCREILSEPKRFEAIRRAGYEKVTEDLAARDVWPRLFERCLAGDFPRPSYDLGRVRLTPFEICAQYNGFEHLLDHLKDDHA